MHPGLSLYSLFLREWKFEVSEKKGVVEPDLTPEIARASPDDNSSGPDYGPFGPHLRPLVRYYGAPEFK